MKKPRHATVKYVPDYIPKMELPVESHLRVSSDKQTIFRRNSDGTLAILTNDQETVSMLSSSERVALALWLLGNVR